MRIGFGYDSHRFSEGRRLILGGVEVPSERGLLGHSDADVLLHSVGDAVLGAIGEGDIGKHFPDSDPAYMDISSRVLLLRVKEMMLDRGFCINNIDSTIVLESPRLAQYIGKMVKNIADDLDIVEDRVNIKATTNEGMGFIGRSEGIAAFAVVTVKRNQD
jgi:2-C-methyl-D-erythritol 2,4-cyclodiphosphate synthase